MTKVIRIPDGLMTLAESKAVCPHCEKKIEFEAIEKKWMRQRKHWMKFKCNCKKLIGIAQDMRGDYIAFDHKSKQNENLFRSPTAQDNRRRLQ